MDSTPAAPWPPRADTVRALGAEAGFGTVEVLPVDGGFFRLYRLAAS